MDLREHVLGSILGGAYGDALGGPYEGQHAPVALTEWQPWRISDDTQLTLATCEAIVERDGVVDPGAIAARCARWFRERRVTGIGASTYKALSELLMGGHWALVGRRGEHAAGNGAAMRIAPLGFCLDPSDEESRRTIRDVSRITHHSEEAYAGALAVVSAVHLAASGEWKGGTGLLHSIVDYLPDSNVRDRLVDLALVDVDSIADIAARTGASGYVAESVPLALAAAERVDTLGFERVLAELVAAGGDTDTIASISGQVMGALLGRVGLSERLLQRIPERAFIEATATAFAASILPARAAT